MALRAQGGMLVYPVAIAILGAGSDLHRTAPWAFAAIVGSAVLLGIGRLILLRRLDLYDRSPDLWRLVFYGASLATCALYSGLLWFLTLEKGLTPFTMFALAATLGIAGLAIVMYAHSLTVVWSYILLLGVPPTIALAQSAEIPSALLLAWSNAGVTMYFLWVGWQQHHERWTHLEKRYELTLRAAELEQAQEDLQRTRDVTERRRAESLRLAKDAAERTARAKTQFLANMSHEIRTPMAGVVGLSDLLLATDLDERQRQYARLIQSSAGSLLRVIDDILDFSESEAGRLSFEAVPFDLRAMLNEVIELLRLGAMANGTSLDLDLADDLPAWVRGDPGRLRQALLNLVGNAVKFTEGGSVSVRAELSTPANTGGVHIRVQDTGIGIPLEAQGRLFELFSQGDDSTSRRFGGTGLGLAISKRIVEGMGGEIGFQSAPGAGSTFWITVHLDRATPPPAGESALGLPACSHILTVEDNPINQLVISEQLKNLGYRVTAVSNGLEALEALETGTYDLILMDCQMPHLDGYEATLRIRRLPGETGRIPIVALTAHAVRDELDKCLEVGMNDYITKPFRAEVLQRKLERWLGNAAEAPPEAGVEPPAKPAADPDTALEVFDQRQIEVLRALGRESGADFLTRLCEQFRSQPYLDELRGAIERDDRGVLRARVHGLKGTSSLLGARCLPRLCEQLERVCLEAPREECLRQLALIETEHHRFLRSLDEALGSASA